MCGEIESACKGIGRERVCLERERGGRVYREISSYKNKEYKKAKSFIWMFLKNNPHKR